MTTKDTEIARHRTRGIWGLAVQLDEVGHMALYLASGEAWYVTGQVLVVDGGATG